VLTSPDQTEPAPAPRTGFGIAPAVGGAQLSLWRQF